MTPAKAGSGRHLDPSAESLDDPGERVRALARLLEDGDRAELARLSARLGHAELASWFDRHGGRLLSRRSRAFWAAVLDRPAPPSRPLAAALWPLA